VFLGREHGKNFKNSYQIDKYSYNDNFLAVVIRGKMKFILAEKPFGVSGTLMLSVIAEE